MLGVVDDVVVVDADDVGMNAKKIIGKNSRNFSEEVL
jgi:hypothetical protein